MTSEQSDEKLLLALLKESVDKCYKNDSFLIERSMEQASVARIYFYMQCALKHDKRFVSFRELNLDCEYYKHGDDIKRTQGSPNGTRPDIVLHKRGNDTNNLLVIEFKTERGAALKEGNSKDLKKLEDFTNCDTNYKDNRYNYGYFLGVYVELEGSKAKYTYFHDGCEISETDLLKGIT